jgi:hypothetical protein
VLLAAFAGARALAAFLAGLRALLDDLLGPDAFSGPLLFESCPEISCSSVEADILFPEPDFFDAMLIGV